MARYKIKDPTGTIRELEGPDGASDEEVIAQAQKLFAVPTSAPGSPEPVPAAPAPVPKTSEAPTVGRKPMLGSGSGTDSNVAGFPEAAAHIATGATSSALGGVAGIGATVKGLWDGKSLDEALSSGADTVQKIQHAGTFQPRSDIGKATVEKANLPMTLANDLLGRGGGMLGKALGGAKGEAAGESIGENIVPAALAAQGGRTAMRSMKEAPPVPGKDYAPLRTLSGEETERFHRQKEQGVEPTLGSVTRDPSQVRFEQQTAATKAGTELDQRMRQNDQALADHIDTLKNRPNLKNSKPVSETDAGRQARTALEAKAAAKKQKIDDAYAKARESGETKELVDLDPITRYLDDHKAEAISVPKLNSVRAMVDDLKTQNKKSPGMATIDQIENLRQRVGELAQGDGSVSKYMGDLRKGIDTMTEGKGGELYKAARKERREYATEFEDNAGVSRILDRKPATRADYQTATEGVWGKSVLGGSVNDLGNVLGSLRSSRGPQKANSVQALKDMQAHTVDYILNDPIKGATQQGGLSPAKLKARINEIGPEKMRLLLGKQAFDKLNASLDTLNDLKTNPRRVPGSDTSVNIKNDVERMAAAHAESMVTGVLPAWAGRFVNNFMSNQRAKAESRATAAQVDEALTPRQAATADIRSEAATIKKAHRTHLMKEAGQRLAPPVMATIGEDD